MPLNNPASQKEDKLVFWNFPLSQDHFGAHNLISQVWAIGEKIVFLFPSGKENAINFQNILFQIIYQLNDRSTVHFSDNALFIGITSV